MVKGKAKPVRAFLLGEVAGEQEERGRDLTPLVGRERELAVLGALADEAAGRLGSDGRD